MVQKKVVVDVLGAERRLSIYAEKAMTQCRDVVGFRQRSEPNGRLSLVSRVGWV